MSAERAIENLVYRYAELIDQGELAAVGRLLGRARYIGPEGQVHAEGAEAITAIYRAYTRLYEDGTPRSHHVTSNLIIEVDGDSARCRSYFTVFQATDSLPLQPLMAGRYVDEFARDSDGWYFIARQIIPRLSGDLSQHLKA
ncbi:nuclear transport factor 2 family protein [Seongchinamella sediminis]|uniref:nuclear transport factor 2 family protein n=1 Tax=Seongchinamella sediminis TaxID=2283635 RepID=UPI0019677C19|nr:nuclear transport factor 2 family protein [Seongchinamella sediminis]